MYEAFFAIVALALLAAAYIKRSAASLLLGSAAVAIPFVSYAFGIARLGEYDAFAAFVSLSAALALLYAAFASPEYPSAASLMIASAFGALIAALSENRLRILVGRELGSVPTYILVAYDGRLDAAKRYAGIGIIGSIAMLLGLALYAISAGTLNFAAELDDLGRLGLLFILSGMLVKIPVVPVHGRLVDAFDEGYAKGLPRIASGTKVVVFAALSYIVLGSFPRLALFLGLVIAFTMTYANIAALYEDDILRILAYSTIAHASYAAIGIVTATQEALVGTRIHVLGTTAMKGGLLAFLVAAGFRKLDDLRGLSRTRIGVAFAASILSLIGIPPFIGFRSKYRLFMGSIGTDYRRLAALLVANTVISIGYYARLLAKAFEPGEPKSDHKLLAALILALLFASLLPNELFKFASEAVEALRKIFS